MIAIMAAFAGGAFLAVCSWLIYAYAPTEMTLGPIQKIFYLHVPLAWWGMISFFLVFIASIMYLRRRAPKWDQLAEAAAEIGVLFTGLSLLSGMIWGRVSWGIWWTWEPRLTTTLVMWFIYASWLLLRHMDMEETRKRAICAAIGIVAFLDVPLVFFSARIFRSIHPAVLGARGGGLEPEMLLTLILCICALGFFWLALLLVRKTQLAMKARLREIAFSDYFAAKE